MLSEPLVILGRQLGNRCCRAVKREVCWEMIYTIFNAQSVQKLCKCSPICFPVMFPYTNINFPHY